MTRLAHLADVHLGFRQYDRAAPGGMNQREADVQDALGRTVDDLLVVRPDLILIAGDVFHQVRPPNAAIVFLSRQLERLRTALPETRIVVIAGNHDTPRTGETGTILPLYRRLGVDVVTAGVAQVTHRDCVVTCVPSSAARGMTALPDPYATFNVLLLHAAVSGCGYGEPDAAAEQLAAWNYVALGDFHVCHQVGPRAWYAGSTEWTSSDQWSEVREQPAKGYLLVELAVGAEPVVEFRPIPTRRLLDLPPVDAVGLGAQDLDAALAATLAPVDLTGAVARLVVLNVSRDLQRAIDYAALRMQKARAFHLQVDFRRPEVEARTWAASARQARTLAQIVDQFLEARALPADVEREALRALGQEYLAAASEVDDPYQKTA